jgi:cupin fold WbuC family metalloprotein
MHDTSDTASGAQLIDSVLIERTLERARSSTRLRTNHNFHGSHTDPVHRFLNAWIRGTYVAPHRHVAVPKSESFLVLQGELACFVFDDTGVVRERHILGRNGVYGIDLPPAVWHTLAPLTETAVCYEVKPGPWDPATDKEFASWAPLEGDPRAPAYLAALLASLG